ncbi:MAG TPA: ergothioneine biosynthesis protein EgtB [Acidimicrobiales bacterium]
MTTTSVAVDETAAAVARYLDVRDHTERLAAPLSAEDQTVQSMPDVSPTKWHRAHTTWFFETFLLEPNVGDYRTFHPAYGYLFNSYYEAVGERHQRAERGLLSRPGIDEIAAYRAHVDDAMQSLVATVGVTPLVELGLQHEQQHQELLLMDIKHVLSRNPLLPAYSGDARHSPFHPAALTTSRPAWTGHAGGTVEVGHDAVAGSFAFDNESPRHPVWLQPFEIADRPVTCGEWKAFVYDGGYRRAELWLSEGWATLHANGWGSPSYWSSSDGDWRVFTLAGDRAVADDEPVCHVSYFEADAFARWAGARLPTEAEWEAAVAAGGAATGRGQVWEWTSSAYAPYPGFRPAPGAVGEYNGKFMVNQYVLRGGSCVTPAGHTRTTYRNFFPASARWAFSGLRLARDA